KTTALVGRIVALVAGGAQMRRIAAITFTEAAAAELRDKVRAELEKAAGAGIVAPEAVAEVDEAAVSTLHAFAQRILAEHPLEAGLPPAFEVLDEIQSGLAFEERWGRFLDELLDDPTMGPVVLRGLATDLRLEQLQQVALAFHDHWDRLEDLDLGAPPLAPVDVAPIVAALRAAHAMAGACTGDDDLLLAHIEGFAERADRLERAGSELEALHLMATAGKFAFGKGRATNWTAVGIERVKELCTACDGARDAVLTEVRRTVLAHLLVAVQRFTLAAADERRAQGRLEFQDLLVLSRRLLRADHAVRRTLRDRFSHLLIDEFQDTDPIQIELALLLAADDDETAVADWRDATIEAGRLFFVGDAKQSIYRFRRADITRFMEVEALVGNSVALTQNFRSVPGLLAWVNHVFTETMGEGLPGVQARYQPLVAERPPLDDAPPVVLLGRAHPKSTLIGDVREVEAGEVAGAIRRIRAEGWTVTDDQAEGGTRPARFSDIAILLPTRTSLPQLEHALEDEEIAYRVQSSSLVWGTQEVRDLLAVLAAVDDPTNEVALVAALRAPAFACGDDELLEYKQHRGQWSIRGACPDELPPDHPVCAAIDVLRRLHDRRWWLGVSGMVDEAARQLAFFELAFAHHRPRDYWRRLRFVIDQARAFEEGGAQVTLRDFVSWAEQQGADDARAKESVLPEADDDAVRIFTVHGAKGLEFPICVLSGLNRAKYVDRGVVVLWDDGGRPEVRMGAKFSTAGFDAVKGWEKGMSAAEQQRLLYVATTRARDHMVVSVHHKEGDESAAAHFLALSEPAPELWRTLEPELTLRATEEVFPPVASGGERVAREHWRQAREAALAAGRRAPVVSATELAKADDDAPTPDPSVDDPTAPWRRGRAGTAIGRAVHAVLQVVDLGTGDGLAELARAQAAAEGIDDEVELVERLARTALESDVVKEAVQGRHWREMYVAAPLDIGGTSMVVEGYIDLLYETADGLVVVDWKTDATSGPASVEALRDRYQGQVWAYGRVIAAALGTEVARCVLVVPTASTTVDVPRPTVDVPRPATD
ncbi:MAG TPA: UvrD-helicase domain-containing protein, partial [Acidimicrobiales bacterium]|nr:UvrD-helicase domain-containing protein [Acidimicrobiales bacterium]